MTTALEQIREDQALGAAWRRCEAALPEGFGWNVSRSPIEGEFQYMTIVAPDAVRVARWAVQKHGPTPTRALEALAEALEAKKA